MFLTSIATAKLPYVYSQDEICEWYVKQSAGVLDAAWVRSMFEATEVQGRRFVLPLEEIVKARDFGERNGLFLEYAPHILQGTLSAALDKAGLDVADVQALATVTSSGFLTPSLDSYVINDAHLSDHTRRLPIVGLGCAAGVSGLAHAINWATGAGCQNVILAAIELNSLTYRPQDIDKVNAVGAALFADGAAAVVCRADATCGWKLTGSGSYTLSKSTDLMGWNMDANGYGLILLEDVPEAVAEMTPDNLRRFLEQQGLTQTQIKSWVLHPGGPKILSALAKATQLPDAAIQRSRDGLARYGNLSSCSVLYSLAEFIQEPAKHGDHAMCVAFGPGFSMEMVLLRYCAQ
jgi:alkylresorcinol/alkylpyrone synthase